MKSTIATTPIPGQKPGTSGLRKKTRVFMGRHYLENFIQSLFDVVGAEGKTFVLGGDGRYFNDRAAQVILRMAAANGAVRVIVGQGAILSTPAASHLIRLNKTDGGIIMSASHNPGGPDEDFGVKFNMANGGPAPEAVTEAMFARSGEITEYHIFEAEDVDLSTPGTRHLGGMEVVVADPVSDYADLMESLFDFKAIRDLFKTGFRMRMDSMCAVTGPYAREIFETRLGAAPGTVVNAEPLPDFGGMHPDPNPTWAKTLMDEMFGPDAPDFGAASDGDGDRNMVVGRGIYVSPSDSLAVRKESVADILTSHWSAFGRNFYSRHDFEAIETAKADTMFAALRTSLASLPGRELQGMVVEAADDFAYTDPVDGSVSTKQGIRVLFRDGSRIVYRLSGTGTEGATLRVYLERYAAGPKGLDLDAQEALAPVIRAAHDLAEIAAHTGRTVPDVVT